MAAIQFDQSKGREVELYNRVDTNDPTNSALIMSVIASGSVNGIQGLRSFATFAAVFAGGYTEVTNTGYSRKTLTDSSLSAFVVDNTNHWIRLVLPLQTFTTISAGDIWDIVMVGYDDNTTSGTDANIVPVTAAEIRNGGTAIAPNGGNIIIDYSTAWITAT